MDFSQHNGDNYSCYHHSVTFTPYVNTCAINIISAIYNQYLNSLIFQFNRLYLSVDSATFFNLLKHVNPII